MTDNAALRALQRLRALRVQQAQIAYETASAAQARQQCAVDGATAAIQRLDGARWVAQSTPMLSIDRIECLEQVRPRVAELLSSAQADLSGAMEATQDARRLYLAARADARVSERAHSRAEAASDRARELNLFDRLAELLLESHK